MCECTGTPDRQERVNGLVLALDGLVRAVPTVQGNASVLRVPARWQRRSVARHPAAVTGPLAPARLRTCLSARRPALQVRRILVFVTVFTRRDRSIACARCYLLSIWPT